MPCVVESTAIFKGIGELRAFFDLPGAGTVLILLGLVDILIVSFVYSSAI
jgi:hypothetical protein